MAKKEIRRTKADLARERHYHNRAAAADKKNPVKPRSEKEKATKKASSKKSRKNAVFLAIDHSLLSSGLQIPRDVSQTIANLVDKFTRGSQNTSSHCSSLFDRSTTSLRKLPIGLLGEKECTLPDELLPTGEVEILAHCRWMISAQGSDDYINFVVSGWPSTVVKRHEVRKRFGADPNAGSSHLQEHASSLARLEETDFDLYRAIISGRHRSAMQILQKAEVGPKVAAEARRLLIAEHGLLWCARDVQLITARSAKAEQNPLEALASTSMTQLKPENIANQARRLFVILKKVVADYATSLEHTGGKPLATIDNVPETMRPLYRQIEAVAKFYGINLTNSIGQLDQLIEYIRITPIPGNVAWRQMLDSSVSENGLPSSFNALWFSELSMTQAVSVSILRYLQSEREILNLLDERDGGHSRRLRKDTAMSPFNAEELGANWFTAAKDMLFMLRRDILQDKDFKDEGYDYPDREPTAGRNPIQNAKAFVTERGQRAMTDHESEFGDPRRTFYLLDVIPEHRLAL
ncbi:hypothetical protein MKP08_10430 [Erythrobacter sp. LQ02-29]|uniref:hypothetical protein n=1 Tax=Erythrobacter sp. LQ02-29 TaxID=2920384 RepID=UPI001F4EB6D9|nr:hypothetical protein [Erythrobacter sp. LQ02-29]MCP9223166.1 hypothetical protein [Erythrobacter sp. LQ02-29]